MSDAIRDLPARPLPLDSQEALPGVLVTLPHIEANDNEAFAASQQPEARLFELPSSIWLAMVACYAIFLVALLGATGGAHATFAIAIAGVYVAMFFGTARVMLRTAPPQPSTRLNRPGAVLETAFGPLARAEVYAQALIVPAGVAFFGVAVAIVRSSVT
ncbi:hypothetical protein G7A66_06015 [Altererythrobacter sp. SALINAS58]|uniref:hypothetical protein n=1 Tax=Alteripontixanthobacter muriae TaxID=2705546 RepID=UPI0015776897|nr:hypothetical protein [Alteripontixanthobacter muriae]NTZ42647.1 hypothetical protein [Alteripontixanthobacter muriae]